MSHPPAEMEQNSKGGRGRRSPLPNTATTTTTTMRQMRSHASDSAAAAAARLHSTSAQIILHLQEKLQARPPGIAKKKTQPCVRFCEWKCREEPPIPLRPPPRARSALDSAIWGRDAPLDIRWEATATEGEAPLACFLSPLPRRSRHSASASR